MAIPMLKIRRPTSRLIFNMGIPIPGKTVFLIETGPWCLFGTRTHFNTKTIFPGMETPRLTIRWSRDHLVFNTGIPILVRQHLYAARLSATTVQTQLRFQCHMNYQGTSYKRLWGIITPIMSLPLTGLSSEGDNTLFDKCIPEPFIFRSCWV